MDKIKELLKNKIVLIVIAVVIILVILLGIKIFSKPKVELELSRAFDLDKYILIQKDNKYGYINTNGQIIIEPKYKDASTFNGNFALVRTDDNKYQIIDKKGNVKAEAKSSYDIEYISETDSWIVSGVLYDSNMNKVTKDGILVDYSQYNMGYLTFEDSNNKTVGIMTSKGKKTFEIPEPEDSYIGLDVSENEFELKDEYCRINVDNEKYAIINCATGKIIYELSDKYISVEDNNVFEIYNGDYDSDKLETIYIQDDKIEYKIDSEKELTYYSKDVLRIEDDSKSYSEKYTYYDLKSKTELTEKPSVEVTDEWEILTGFTTYKCNSKYGIMKSDKIILNCEWSDIDYLDINLYKFLESEGKEYILLEKDDITSLYNLKNKKIVETFNTDYVYTYSGSTFIKYEDNDTNEIVIYNLVTGKTAKFEENASIKIYSNYIMVKNDDVIKYYNADLEMIYEQK